MILVQTLFRLDIDLTMNPLHWPVLCLLQRRVCHGSDKNLIGMVSGWTVVGIFRRSLYRVTEPYQERR